MRRPGNNYCVARSTPNGTFIEAVGTKKTCMDYAFKAEKPYLRICKMVPVVKWNREGQIRKIG